MSASRDQTLAQALAESLRSHASRTAFVCEDEAPPRRVSYAELDRAVEVLRPQLRALGVTAGQIVPLFCCRTPEAAAVALAAVFEGAAFCFLNPKYRIAQLRFVFEATRAIGVVIDHESLLGLRDPRADELRTIAPIYLERPGQDVERPDGFASAVSAARRVERSGPARSGASHGDGLGGVLFTSGSTGTPKGVLISSADLVARARTEIDCFGVTPEDALLGLLPLSFDVGANQLLTSLLAGATLHLAGAWMIRDLQRIVAASQISGIAAVPSLWSAALAALEGDARLFADCPRLRFVTVSGGSLPAATFARLCKALPVGVSIHKTYGQTETFRSCVFLDANAPEHRGCLDRVGQALPGVRVLIARDRDQLASPNEVGEVIHVGQGTMLRYLDDEALTKVKLGRHRAAGDATVVYTGDRGAIDEDGYLTLAGRADAMMKIFGQRVYPREIENAIAECPGVQEVVVCGIPDRDAGERVIAVVLAETGVEPHQIKAFVAGRLPSYMVPVAIQIWPELPRTASGKPALAQIRDAVSTSTRVPGA